MDKYHMPSEMELLIHPIGEVWEWVSIFIQIIMDVITYRSWD